MMRAHAGQRVGQCVTSTAYRRYMDDDSPTRDGLNEESPEQRDASQHDHPRTMAERRRLLGLDKEDELARIAPSLQVPEIKFPKIDVQFPQVELGRAGAYLKARQEEAAALAAQIAEEKEALEAEAALIAEQRQAEKDAATGRELQSLDLAAASNAYQGATVDLIRQLITAQEALSAKQDEARAAEERHASRSHRMNISILIATIVVGITGLLVGLR